MWLHLPYEQRRSLCVRKRYHASNGMGQGADGGKYLKIVNHWRCKAEARTARIRAASATQLARWWRTVTNCLHNNKLWKALENYLWKIILENYHKMT